MASSDESEGINNDWDEAQSGPDGLSDEEDGPFDHLDEDDSGTDGSSDEEDGPFDRLCAICDNGGRLLCCEGKCFRSFHATPAHGSDSLCESLGLSNEQFEAINKQETFHCLNCHYNQHQCFVCGELGSSDKSYGAEVKFVLKVFQCGNEECRHFYHSRCVAKLVYSDTEAKAEDFHNKITAGEPFTCPVHKCVVCKHGENWVDHDLQFAMCRRCPRSYHRKCLPREIAFDSSKRILPRAWEGLLPKHRIIIYCLKHDIDVVTLTPPRDHIKFPTIDAEGVEKFPGVIKHVSSSQEKERIRTMPVPAADPSYRQTTSALEEYSPRPEELNSSMDSCWTC